MADKLVVVKDNGICELATLKPYPAVASGTNTTVSTSTDATGKVTYTVAASGGSDSYVTGVTISPAGLVTLTRNNGLPNLTAQIDFPEPTEMVFPMAGYRTAFIGGASSPPPFTSNGYVPFNEFINETGGFPTTLGLTDIPVPKTGWYRIDHRATMRYTGSPPTAACRVVKGTTPLETLGINFGHNYFPYMSVNEQAEVEKSMYHYLVAGDIIRVETTNMGSGAELIGETLLLKWESA